MDAAVARIDRAHRAEKLCYGCYHVGERRCMLMAIAYADGPFPRNQTDALAMLLEDTFTTGLDSPLRESDVEQAATMYDQEVEVVRPRGITDVPTDDEMYDAALRAVSRMEVAR